MPKSLTLFRSGLAGIEDLQRVEHVQECRLLVGKSFAGLHFVEPTMDFGCSTAQGCCQSVSVRSRRLGDASRSGRVIADTPLARQGNEILELRRNLRIVESDWSRGCACRPSGRRGAGDRGRPIAAPDESEKHERQEKLHGSLGAKLTSIDQVAVLRISGCRKKMILESGSSMRANVGVGRRTEGR